MSPEPRRTVIVAVLGLPARSVTEIVIVLMPGATVILASNSPSLPAVVVTMAPLRSFLRRTVLRPWVLPFTFTESLVVDDDSFGVEIFTTGRDWSRIQVVMSDSSLSPPGPMIDAWM